jgi:hypothetical protein
LSRQSNQNERTIAYLLGTLSDEERVRIEERYFSDDAEFEGLEIAEDELIDRYVRGELSSTESQQFEKRVSQSARLVQRVEFARVWANRKSRPTAESSTQAPHHEEGSWWSKLFGFSGTARPRFAPVFAVLLLLVVGAAVFVGWLKWKESKRLAAEQATLEQRRRELEKQAADEKSKLDQAANQTGPQPSPATAASPVDEPTPGPSVIALTLSPGATRGDGGATTRIPPGTSYVAFTLKVQDTDYASYQASVQTMERTTVFSSRASPLRRTQSGATMSFRVPANQLRPGDYLVSVDGLTPTGAKENVHYYRFRVTR